MRLFQLPIPLKPNDGGTYPEASRPSFLDAVLTIAGGYTLISGNLGAWRDPKTGTIYREEMDLLQFTLPDRDISVNALERAFYRAFPDQLCMMVAEIGEARFLSRHDLAA